MRKTFHFFIILLLIFNGLGAIAISDDITYDVKINEVSVIFSDPIINDNGEYIELGLEEATSSLFEFGKPVLPVVTKTFTFPFGSKIQDVNVHFSDIQQINLTKEVKTATIKGPLTGVLGDSNRNEQINENEMMYPPSGYNIITGAGIKDNERVIYLALKFYPIRTSPLKKVIYYHEGFDIKIIYQEPTIPISYNDEYDMVIISPDLFSSSLQPLIEHKNNHGVQTILKTNEEIYNEYNGRDDAEKIKFFIKDAIEKWNIKHVLIVGSIYLTPMRKTAVSIWEYPFWDDKLPTDLYYADIYDIDYNFCSWDSNDNDLFGEYNSYEGAIDEVDLYPDVNIGRLPCKNNREVKTLVNKIINYETQTYGENWFNNLILMGGNTDPDDEDLEGEIINEEVARAMPDFNHIKLWTSTNTFNPRSINKNINSGAGFISYSGHGFEYGIGTSPPDSKKVIHYNTRNLIGLRNKNKLPIVFFDACLTTKLDYILEDLFHYKGLKFLPIFTILPLIYRDTKLPCFAWCMLKKPSGGAIATIGSTRVAFSFADNNGVHYGGCYLNLCFFKSYEPGILVSQMFTKAQNDYIDYIGRDYVTLEQFNLLGDPSLKVGGYP